MFKMKLFERPMMISLYIIGQVLTLLQTCFSQCFNPKTFIINNYSNYSAPRFNLLNNSDLVMCIVVCNRFKLCLSLDWIPEKKTCRLNTRFTIKNGIGLMTEGRIIHVKREKIPEHLAGDCLNHTCTEDSVCIQGNCVPVLKGFKDCSEILRTDSTRKGQDGVYVIYIDNTWREVFCDMTTDGGGWTVIQKREDDVDFYRTWDEYQHGFGNTSKSYWLGNDAIYELTKNKDQELRVELQSFDGAEAHALYSSFYVGNESSKYTLTLSGYSGTAGNSLGYHNGMKFTTKDQDNDNKISVNCAVGFHGAWWYNACTSSNLNGKYAQSTVTSYQCPYWFSWTNGYIALKRTVMMIRHRN